MSHFEVPVVRITKVEDHPNADRLSLNYFREFVTISAKQEDGSHRYQEGDFVVYVPEGAVVPDYLLHQGFWDDRKNKGMLAGSKGNRVKPAVLRGVLSQGIMFPVIPFTDEDGEMEFFRGADGVVRNHTGTAKPVIEGTDVAEFLGIVKYEPPIPSHMSGQIKNSHISLPKHDVENIKKYPDYFDPQDDIIITEKLHGTMTGIGFDTRVSDEPFVFSKGLGAKGLVFKQENNETNLYVQMLLREGYIDKLRKAIFLYFEDKGVEPSAVYFFGETYGKGIQDLAYDGINKPNIRLFDMVCMQNVQYVWANALELFSVFGALEIDRVPVLYIGKADNIHDLRNQHRDGESILGGSIKEGIVFRKSEAHPDHERLLLKDISEAYLTRKGGTEFN